MSNSSKESANLFDLLDVTGFATDIDITGERYAVPSSIEFDEISISLRVTEKQFINFSKIGILDEFFYESYACLEM